MPTQEFLSPQAERNKAEYIAEVKEALRQAGEYINTLIARGVSVKQILGRYAGLIRMIEPESQYCLWIRRERKEETFELVRDGATSITFRDPRIHGSSLINPELLDLNTIPQDLELQQVEFAPYAYTEEELYNTRIQWYDDFLDFDVIQPQSGAYLPSRLALDILTRYINYLQELAKSIKN